MCEYSFSTPKGKMCSATNSICPKEFDDCGTRIETLIEEWLTRVRDVTPNSVNVIRNYLGNYDISVGQLNDMPINER